MKAILQEVVPVAMQGGGAVTIKKGDKLLRAYTNKLAPATVITLDMRGFESFVFTVSGSSFNRFTVETSTDLSTWIPIPITAIKGNGFDYPLMPLEFQPIFVGDSMYGHNTPAPFVRINRTGNGFDDYSALFTIALLGRKLDTSIKPASFYLTSYSPYFNTAPLPESAGVFPENPQPA